MSLQGKLMKPNANSINFGLHQKSRDFLNSVGTNPSGTSNPNKSISVNNSYTISRYSSHVTKEGLKIPLHMFNFGRGVVFFEILDKEVPDQERNEIRVYTMLAEKIQETFVPVVETRWDKYD
jgi:hypothetical protein